MTVQTLPHDWMALLITVFALGLKHGMDPDHLATIDGLTRFNAASRPCLSRWSGFLFSLGHGAVVMVIAIAVGIPAKGLTMPEWLDGFGTSISILFLLALGAVNLHGVWQAPPNQVVAMRGLKGRWLGRLTQTSHPLLIAGVGALFAISFDTISQAALFSLTASAIAGWLFSLLLGFVFTLGMMVTDGMNGLWVARLLRSADLRARVASRVMGLSVGGLSLLVGALALTKFISPVAASHFEGQQLLFGSLVISIVAMSFLLALRLSRLPH